MDNTLYYRFTNLSNGDTIQPKRGMDAPKIIGNGGRWDIVARPRRASMTLWNGDDPITMDVPILFDGFEEGQNQENDIMSLEAMRIRKDDYDPPPRVQVDGALPKTGIDWIITGIDYGDMVLWGLRGYRLRQDAVVHLTEFIAPDQLNIRPSTVAHTHKVVEGETLASIAKVEYGDTKYAGVIKSANNIRDPKKLPKTLNIPPLIGK